MATKTKDVALAELAELGASLADDAEDAKKKQETLSRILGTIGELDKATATELFKNEKVQRLIELASGELAEARDDRPGSIALGPDGKPLAFAQKKPWNEADLSKLIDSGEMPLVSFTPTTSQPVIWNGLRRNFVADEEAQYPKCFVDVYRDSKRMERQGREHAAWLFRNSNGLSDPSMMSERGLKARASGDKGHYVPGGGNVAMGDTEGAE